MIEELERDVTLYMVSFSPEKSIGNVVLTVSVKLMVHVIMFVELLLLVTDAMLIAPESAVVVPAD